VARKPHYERQTTVTISDSTVAIIGIGTIGSTLAANFAAGGQDFLLAGRDQEAARKIAADLDGHAEAASVGGLDQSIRIEMFGDLHEYGALGRVVTKSEALKAI
jgi:8-hydroxy-5-deazaflavin:NADPH oxidoreductase